MKKEFGALCALLASSLAVPALAQPKDFSIYGVMDLGVRRSSGLTDTYAPSNRSLTSLNSGIVDASRWGVRGLTPIGGGQSVVWELESGFNADTGSPLNSGNKFFNRGSWIGIQDNSERLSIGRQSSLLADSLSSIDALQGRFADFNPNVTSGALGQHDLSNQFGNSGVPGNLYWLDNAVKLSSRSGPYRLSGMYSFGEQAGNSNQSRKGLSSYGLTGAWEDNGLILSGTYQNFKDIQGRNLKAWMLGTGYRSGTLRLSASAARNQADLGDAAQLRQRIYSLGATMSTTQQSDWTLAYYKVQRERPQLASDGYGRFVALYEYKFTLRTKLYAEFDLTNWNDGYQGPGNKSRATGFALGMQYRF